MSKIDSPRSSLEHIRALCVAYDSTPEVFQRTFRSEVAKAADAGLAACQPAPLPMPMAPPPVPTVSTPPAWLAPSRATVEAGLVVNNENKNRLAIPPKDVYEALMRIREAAGFDSLTYLLAEAGIGLLKTGRLAAPVPPPIVAPPVLPAPVTPPATVSELANVLRSILTQPTLTPDLKDQSIDLLKRVPK